MPQPQSCLLNARHSGVFVIALRHGASPQLAAASCRQPKRRQLHSAPRKPSITSTAHKQPAESYITDASLASSSIPTTADAQIPPPVPRAPLAGLPLGMLLRNLIISTATASPLLLPPSLALLSRVANPTGTLLNLDKNPVLRLLVKKVLYQQFCAGENGVEVAQTCDKLRRLGFTGVILCYGREASHAKGDPGARDAEAETRAVKEIEAWRRGNLETVGLAKAGDYVAVKFSGAGRHVVSSLANRSPPPQQLADAIDELCTLATSRGVQLLIDAEQVSLQGGIDDWGLAYMRKYNAATPGRATVFGTYQAYLKSAPAVLKAHVDIAQKEGFTLGVKLVRGAYLATEKRDLIHDTKADTDKCFDDLIAGLLARQWTDVLPGSGAYPQLSLIVATHNADSVQKARSMVEAGEAKTAVAFAQLQGMADEVSFGLIDAAGAPRGPALGAYKYFAWGSTTDCMKYLLRRAEENRDAVGRTKDSRNAMWAELTRRLRGVVGLQ